MGQRQRRVMNKLNYIIEKYPVVFKKPDTIIYSELPDGWIGIVDELCNSLTPILEESYKQYPLDDCDYGFVVEQIKEKFGGLRIYFQLASQDPDLYNKITKLVFECELKSKSICQISGKPGSLCKKNNWYYTLSEEYQKEHGYEAIKKTQD